MQRIADQGQQVGGGDIDRLHALEIENDEIAGFQFAVEIGIELLRGAEEQAALQFENHCLVALLFEDAGFRFRAVPVRRHLVDVELVPHHRAADLLAQEKHDRQRDANGRGGDQADGNGDDHHGDDDAKIEDGRRGLDEAQRLAVDHAQADDDENAGQRRHRNPGDEAAQDERKNQRRNALDQAGGTGFGATGEIDQRRAHGAGAGNAADRRRGDVGDALGDQFAVGVVAAARHLVEDDAGFQGVDRQQHRQRQGAAEQRCDLRQPHVADLVPAAGDRRKVAIAGGAQFANDQRIVDDLQHGRVLHRQREVGGQSGGDAEDGAGHALGQRRADEHGGDGRAANRQRPPVPQPGRHQHTMPGVAAFRADQLADLAADDDQADAGEVAADYGVGNVFDQPADADETEQHLEKPGKDAEHQQHEHDVAGGHAVAHQFDGEGGENGGGGGAGGADQAVGAAQHRGDQADDGGADDAGQRPECGVAGADGRVDGDAEGNRCRQRDQHGRQPAPEIAGDVAFLAEEPLNHVSPRFGLSNDITAFRGGARTKPCGRIKVKADRRHKCHRRNCATPNISMPSAAITGRSATTRWSIWSGRCRRRRPACALSISTGWSRPMCRSALSIRSGRCCRWH